MSDDYTLMVDEARKKVPGHLLEALDAYFKTHRPTGHFLQGVLENNLHRALAHADLSSRASLYDIVSYVYNFCPDHAWGSAAAYSAWTHRHEGERRPILVPCPTCGGMAVQESNAGPVRSQLPQ